MRNGYFHPRNHIAEHFIERGDRARGARLLEEIATELREADVPGHTLGPAIYNVACLRVAEGRHAEALTLLEEALPMRADLPGVASRDPDLAALRDDARFQALINRSPAAAQP